MLFVKKNALVVHMTILSCLLQFVRIKCIYQFSTTSKPFTFVFRSLILPASYFSFIRFCKHENCVFWQCLKIFFIINLGIIIQKKQFVLLVRTSLISIQKLRLSWKNNSCEIYSGYVIIGRIWAQRQCLPNSLVYPQKGKLPLLISSRHYSFT